MKVSRNSYYSWLKQKHIINESLLHLKSRVRFHFEDNYEIYGGTRIQKKLVKEGLVYSVFYVGY